MTLLFIRIFFLVISVLVGFYVGSFSSHPAYGTLIGVLAGMLLIGVEISLRRVSVRGLSSMVFGLLLGFFMANLTANILSLLPLGEFVQSVSRVILTIIFSYLGAVMALRGKNEFHVIIPYVRFKRQEIDERVMLVDTSAIVDGRIVDLCKTNFFAGRMVIPRFVLQELQRIADSDDPVKRQRGRRGLEIVRNMQKDAALDVRIHEDDAPVDQDVDTKLIRLAKLMDARIYTVDYNLSRVATIQGVETLNINELVNAVKPAVFPGEEMDVCLLREGKEQNQAVAYTDDGTMIVVSDAKHLIGKKARVNVVSVLQTQAGRMIFAKVRKSANEEAKPAA
jgi:uncharacterized protein YacL